MIISIKDYDGESTYMDINVGGREVVVRCAYTGVCFRTDLGDFGISQRDGGIVVKLNGDIVYVARVKEKP